MRILLSARPDVVEKKMVGGLSFLVNGNMCCGVIVDPPGYTADDALARWVQRGLDFVSGLPAK